MRIYWILILIVLLSGCGMREGEYYLPKNKSCLYLTQDYVLEQGLMGKFLYSAGNYYPTFSDKNGTYYLPRKKVQIVLDNYQEDVNYGIYMANGVPYTFYLDKFSGVSVKKLHDSTDVITPPEVTGPFPGGLTPLLQKRKC